MSVPAKQIKDLGLALRSANLTESILSKLGEVNRDIAKAGLENPIKEIEDKELVTKVGSLAVFIAKDYGIKTAPDQYEVTRFYDILRRYYKEFSLQEIKLAFELATVGELDEYLPRDKEGKPDKGHYQTFSVEYVTKILTAYKKRRSKLWVWVSQKNREAQANRTLEDPAKKKRIKDAFLGTVIDVYEEFRKTGRLTTTVPMRYVYKALSDANLCSPELPEPTEEQRQRVIENLKADKSKGFHSKQAILRAASRGYEPTIEATLLAETAYEAVKEVFMELDMDDIDLRKKLKES